jgi:choline dehydrogenase
VRSEGSVTLFDDDPLRHPRVEFRMLSDPADVEGLADAVEAAFEILGHAAFRSITHDVYIDDQGTTVDALDSRERIVEWLPSYVGDYVHAACSCRMGTALDDQCRLIGYEGLAVCDASAFPDIPEVNTHIPTVMLAETMAARWLASDQ